MPTTIIATPEAKAALARIRSHHGPVLLHVTGGCCDARTPLCLSCSDLRLGPRDVLLGTVDDVPVYEMESAPDDVCACCGALILDVVDGLPVGFSLEAAPGKRFTLRDGGTC